MILSSRYILKIVDNYFSFRMCMELIVVEYVFFSYFLLNYLECFVGGATCSACIK